MNSYEAKQEQRRERLEKRAEAARGRASAAFRKADMREEVSGIPFGQPILVGHYSEGRHRAAIKRADNAMRRGIEETKKADRLEQRAEAVGSGGISSDDPDAIAKLKAELAGLEQRQEAMKAANLAWRKAGNTAGRQKDGTWMDSPYPPYSLSNNSQNMARIKGRIAQLERNATRTTKEVTFDGICRLVQNVEANRLQMIFDGKPSDTIRKLLKSHGFRWSPTEGAWQRHLSNAAIWASGQIIAKAKEA